MSKINEENPEIKIPEEQIKSSKRMSILSKHVSEAIKKADKEIEGEFTLMEVIHVMNQNSITYIRHGLKNEWS